MQINGENGRNAAHTGIASRKNATVSSAVTHGDDPLGTRRRLIGALQRLAHVRRDPARHEEHIGVTRRCDETQTESLEIVDDVVECMDLELAAVAGSGIPFCPKNLDDRRRRFGAQVVDRYRGHFFR